MLNLNEGILVLKPGTVLGAAIENWYFAENCDFWIQPITFITNYAIILEKNMHSCITKLYVLKVSYTLKF